MSTISTGNKVCIDCGFAQPAENFRVLRNPDRREPFCIKCGWERVKLKTRNKRRLKNRRFREAKKGTWKHFIRTKWSALNSRTVNGTSPKSDKFSLAYIRKEIRLDMTRTAFEAWCYERRKCIELLYNAATEFDDAGLLPSIDRVDPNGNYSLNNIALTTWRLNSLEGARTMKGRSKSSQQEG